MPSQSTQENQSSLPVSIGPLASSALLEAYPFSTLVVDPGGAILAANAAAERMFGYSREELLELSPLALHEPAELIHRARQLETELGIAIEPGTGVLFARPRSGLPEDRQWTCVRKDRTRMPVQLAVSALTGEDRAITGFLLVACDITERKRQEQYISHIAHHDGLTGLPTRFLFRDRVEVALNRLARYGGRCAVMLLDLDHFKNINDSLGHHAGDGVLVLVARRLREALRNTDTLSRMGGDEFTILLDPVQDEAEAVAFAENLLARLHEPLRVGDAAFSITASIGVSVYPDAGDTPTSLLKSADTAMYHAKALGRQRVTLFTQSLAEAATRRLHLEMALKRALDLHEFTVVYQPQVSLEDNRLIGVEALVRWRNDRLGHVSPAEFIPLAEQCGVIGPLGEWVLRTACFDLRELHRTTGNSLRLAVNLSPRQLEREGFPGTVAAILEESHFPAHQLEMEITEGVLMSDSVHVWESIKELQSLGLQTAIDDFGTGFSNASYLLRLAVNRIKIDRSFISGLEDDLGCNAVVSSLLSMAADLGVEVVAEGVETIAQTIILRQKECQIAQGYFFYKPMPLADLRALLVRLKTHD